MFVRLAARAVVRAEVAWQTVRSVAFRPHWHESCLIASRP
jgi:hypothetical protein